LIEFRGWRLLRRTGRLESIRRKASKNRFSLRPLSRIAVDPALWACTCLAVISYSGTSRAQSYPAKPVRIVVGFLPGGAVDITARLLTPKLSDALGQSVIIDNRPGAGGIIAAESVAKGPSDGYTLLMIAQPDVVQPALRKNLTYDIVRDFSPVSLLATGPYILCVHPVMPVSTVRDLIAIARAKPGTLNYASAGLGSSAHLANELFNTMAKVKIVHVPFKGTPEGMTAIASGTVDMVLASVASAQPLLAAKKVKGIGVSSAKRFPLYPEMPTINESGLPGFERSGWYGITAPAKTPREIVDKLSLAIMSVVDQGDVKNAYVKQGLLVATSTPEQFTLFVKNEMAEAARLVKSSGTKEE
jgi:tripartite-type tricarboxylate transporter receptor subunit TctC